MGPVRPKRRGPAVGYLRSAGTGLAGAEGHAVEAAAAGAQEGGLLEVATSPEGRGYLPQGSLPLPKDWE